MVVSEIVPGEDAGVFRHYGAGLDYYGSQFCLQAPGRPVREQPNKDYASWAAARYAEVARTEEPIYEHVDALIPENNGEVRRSRYERLLLPLRDGARKFVLGVTRMNAAIDLPFYS
jgi:hypothetical protein